MPLIHSVGVLGTRINVMSVTLVAGHFLFLSLFPLLRLSNLKVPSWPSFYGRSCL